MASGVERALMMPREPWNASHVRAAIGPRLVGTREPQEALCSVITFSPAPPLLSRGRASMARLAEPKMDAFAVSSLLAADDSGINPVFLLLGALPVVAGGAFVLVSGEEKKLAERRADPANAIRLGYTAEEVAKMEELTRLRYEGDLKEFNAAVAAAEATGAPKPNGLTWVAEKNAKKAGYFDGGNNERPTMI